MLQQMKRYTAFPSIETQFHFSKSKSILELNRILLKIPRELALKIEKLN